MACTKSWSNNDLQINLKKTGVQLNAFPFFYGKIVLSPKKKIVPLQPLKAIN